ncbi:MAG TPA: HAMP domain-containing sensor histidine kinase [Bacteroidales bacterium]|nr:HAMP domain-containing sensor histidine kinase [Bacteroidales bacterium]HPT21233.1 HAMP domain-containing sensor histidine kinase [Bacteroidales bacterium]
MKGKRYTIFLVISTVVVVLTALIAESVYFSDYEYRFRTRRFNKILRAKETIMEDCLNNMKPILAREEHHGSISENNLFSVAEQNGITILEYIDNKLIYWSDNEFNVPQFIDDSLYNKHMIFLQNGWFLTKTVQSGNEKIVGLLRLHTDYSFENDIIKSGFAEDFRMPGNVGFKTVKGEPGYDIFNKEGNFLFSLSFPDRTEKTLFLFIPLFLWAAAFALLILLCLELARILAGAERKKLAAGFTLLSFSLIYIIILFSGEHSVLMQTELFKPYRFTLNRFIPSLGHLMLITILAACFSYAFYNHFSLSERKQEKSWKDFLYLSGLLIFTAVLLVIWTYIFRQLVLNSNISFETYKVLELNVFSAIGFASLILLLLVPLFFILIIFRSVRLFRPGVILSSILVSTILLFIIHPGDRFFYTLPFLFIILSLTCWLLVKRKMGLFNKVSLFSLIISIYSLSLITCYSEKRITENLKVQAVSFSTENDPEAEHLLLDLWPVITKDSLLIRMMNVETFEKVDVDRIQNYLIDRYFTGYWRNFNFIFTLCRNNEKIRIGQGGEKSENCFAFFNELILSNGHQLTGTDFYFLDNQGGRSYYAGRLFFKGGDNVTNGLFIQFYSDVNVFQPGYSELLLDKKYHGYAGLKDYSFAKYINGEVVLRTGEFPYDKSDEKYVEGNSDYKYFESEGYRHVLYKNGNTTILISRPGITVNDMVVSFAYLFAFVFLFLYLLLLLVKRPDMKDLFNYSFRQKLQMSYIGILLFSFILIGGEVVSFSMRQYQTKHNENLKSRLNSIYLELDGILSMEKHLSADWRSPAYGSLNDLLIKFSNTFETDINLYDLNGYLIATSRPEIFYRNLTSQRINNMAFINLADLTRSEYFQKEKIGKLEYVSAYVPFFNVENKVIAYLNLPYFRMQSVLAKEISNLVVTVVNFTLLLILITMILVVFISGRLTSPLMMLGEALASVGVGKKSEHLSYKGNDEISILVRQYNRMVDEIEESAGKLANSEREYAWREMAKQIAHEIKNPLTPMKLNVQQLFKSWKDNAPGFDKKFENFTRNQIEYIDNLSSIATAFSSFAKMPVAKPVEVNLLDQIRISLELFKDTDNVLFSVKWPHETKIVVCADKEQLNGVFSNLFKNGIQSIPQGREGLIKIGLETRNNNVIISISDNGTGIPEDLQKKMFTPNFTTKSSGMGLGLSIVKKYVENANGRIWFESATGKGTTFFIELPLKYTVENWDEPLLAD